MRTVALVSRRGAIDWFCYPHFDSPSVFASILDAEKGGCFRIYPQIHELTTKQIYWADTNILVTRFLAEEGVGEIVDYMPIGQRGCDGIVRTVKVVRGTMGFRLECFPRSIMRGIRMRCIWTRAARGSSRHRPA